MSGPGPSSIDPASSRAIVGVRGALGPSDDGVCHEIRSLWLPTDHRNAALGRLASESQADRTSVETGRTESAEETAEAASTVAGRWILYPKTAGASQSCLGLRLRGRSDTGRTSTEDADHRRRIHQGMPGKSRRAAHAIDRCAPCASRSLQPTRRAQV